MTDDSLPYTIPTENGEPLPMKVVNPEKVKTRMKDVGGYDEAKLEVIEFANFLKNPDQYTKIGAHLPSGVLLFGEPGTGKTLLAKATAGEANITFIVSSASEFLIDEGSKLLATVFRKAREYSPCILFLDEIDCIGRKRPESWQDPSVIHQALLKELLTQLDGLIVYPDSTVIVFGATSSDDAVDSAIIRPGRFDRTITLPLPDLSGRYSIYLIHLEPLKTNTDKEVIAKKMAYLSIGFTGAKIAASCNEAAMIAARDLNEEIAMEHFEQAVDRVKSGLRKKSTLSDLEKKHAAYHDAGHAVYGWFTQGIDPPGKLSILPSTDKSRGGSCAQNSIDVDDIKILTKDCLRSLIKMSLSGKLSEELFLNQTSTICQSDLEHSRKFAGVMVCKYGMSERFKSLDMSHILPENYCNESNAPVNEKAKGMILDQIVSITDGCYEEVTEFCSERKDDIEKVAKQLLERSFLSRDDIKDILGDRPFPDATIFNDDGTLLPAGLRKWNA